MVWANLCSTVILGVILPTYLGFAEKVCIVRVGVGSNGNL